MAECLNEPLCVQALVRKPEEKEPSYLCSLPALPHTLSVAEEKAHSAGPAWGGRALFTLGLWETSPPYCACHLHMTHSFPKGPREGGIRGTFTEFIKSLSHAALGPSRACFAAPCLTFLSRKCSLRLCHTRLNVNTDASPWHFCAVYFKVATLATRYAIFNVRMMKA